MGAKLITGELENKICRFYEAGNTIEQTALEFQVSTIGVSGALKRKGTEVRINPHRTGETKQQTTDAAKKLFEEGFSFEEIAEKLNRDAAYIKNLVNKRDVESNESYLERTAIRKEPYEPKFYKVVENGKKYTDITEAILYSGY